MRFIGKRFLSLIDKVLRCIAKTSAASSGQQRRQLSYLKAASFLLKCAGAAVCNICEYQMIGWFFLKLKAIHADRFFFAYL